MNSMVRFLVISLLIWLVPFVVSLPFFGREGKLSTPFWLFKANMLVVLSGTAWYLFRWFYRSSVMSQQPRTTFALLGFGTAAINVALDMVTIVPLMKMTAAQYATQVAPAYLLIVVASITAGLRQTRTENPA